jgi:hypothetical protein
LQDILPHFNQRWIIRTDFHKIQSVPNFTDIRPVETTLIHAEGRMDMTKPIGIFRDCADAPRKGSAPMKFNLNKMYQYVLTVHSTVGSLLMYGLQCLTHSLPQTPAFMLPFPYNKTTFYSFFLFILFKNCFPSHWP